MSSQPDDLTARARIRDAAIALFAEKGIDKATVRDIAAAAGVSSGLLRHHFGSKEGLRDACDDYAVAELARIRAPYVDGRGADEAYVLEAIRSAPLRLQNYLVRSIMDGTPTGSQVYDRMVAEARRWLDHTEVVTDDPPAYAAVICSLQIGMFMLRDQISRAIGEDTRQERGQARMLRAAVEIFSQPPVAPELADQAKKALDRLREGKES